MKTEDASYAAARAKRQQEVRQLIRLTNAAFYGSATEYPFSVDFTSGPVAASTKTKKEWLVSIGGNTQVIEAELGRSSIGTATLGLLDADGEMLKYFANIPLTLNGAHTNSTTTILVNEDTAGYPAQGTLILTTTGVEERVRYLDKTPRSFIGCTRGVDGTSAASHSGGDAVANGEWIRRGTTRVQLLTGFAGQAESTYRSEWKMEVVGRSMDKDRVTALLRLQDIQRRPSRQTIFLTASSDVPISLCGNPIDLALAILLSQGGFSTETGTIAKTAGSAALVGSGTTFTGYTSGDVLALDDGELIRVSSVTDNTHLTAAQTAILTGSALGFRKGGPNGRYDVLDVNNAVGIPSSFVDTATWEALRASDFSTVQYQFSLISPATAKDFLEQQFMMTLNCYPKITQTGQLSIVRYRVAVGVPTVTLDRDSIIGYGWQPADDQIINRVQFSYDWNIANATGIFGTFQEFLAGAEDDDATSLGNFGPSTPLSIQAMGWRTTLGAAAMAAARAKQVTDRFAFPQTILVLDCTFSTNQLEPGDQVYVNDPRIPNIRTGLRGITNEVFEVLDIATSYRPYKTQLTLLWVAAIPTVPDPIDQGTVGSTIPYLTGPVDEQDLDEELGIQVAAFAWHHEVVFTGSSPRASYREATQAFAYGQTSGDLLVYDALFEGISAANTVGGVDLAAIERGPENAASATSTTLVLNAGASGVDSTYNNMYIEILSNGTPAANGQIGKVSSYVGSTKTATVPAWSTTPTGTISYRIIRTGALDFGNDQNGLSAKPTTTLGAGALGQWMHREIALPSAWNGKTLIGMATAMDGAPASQTQILLVRNAVIRNAAGVIQKRLGRYAFTTQGVWGYGAETNGTATVRLETVGQASPASALMSSAAQRAGSVTGINGSSLSTSETVVATLSNLVYINTTEDLVLYWAQIPLTLVVTLGGGASDTLTFRLRADSISGAILGSGSVSVSDGSTGKGGTANTARGLFLIIGIHRPAAVGFKTFVLTLQNSVGSGVSTASLGGTVLAAAKSA